jgi:hypothetical protein
MTYEYRSTHAEIETDERPPEDIAWGNRDVFHGYLVPDPEQPEGSGWELIGTTTAVLHYQNIIVWTWRRKRRSAGKRTKAEKK